MTEVVAAEAKVSKKKRAESPVKVLYVSPTSDKNKRVVEGTTAVTINGVVMDLSKISPVVQAQLAALSLVARAKTYVNNHADDAKAGADIPDLVSKVFADLVAGNVYAAAGEKEAKEFDPTDWIEAVKGARQIAHSKEPNNPDAALATPEQLQALGDKMKAMDKKELADFIAKLKKDELIGPAYNVIQQQKRVAAYKPSAEKSVLETLF